MTDHKLNDLETPWLKHYDAGVPAHITYKKQALYASLDASAAKHPKRTAFIFKNNHISYEKLLELSEIMAANLRREGLKPGERVSIMLPNLPQTVIAFWGVLKAGGVVVMTNPLYMESELVHQLSDSGAKFLITLDKLWPRLEELQDRVPVEKYFITTLSESLKFPLTLLLRLKSLREKNKVKPPFDQKRILPWKNLLTGKERLSQPVDDPENTLALLQYTGGTTGEAKGVMLSHFNLTANLQQISAVLNPTPSGKKDIFIAVLPYFHVYGLTTALFLPVHLSSTTILFPRFDPLELLQGIAKYKPTIFPGAPSIYIAILQQRDLAKYDMHSIDYCISGSAPMPLEYLKQVYELSGASIAEGFGLTEASPVTHLTPLHGTNKHGSIGLPLPDTMAQIVDMEVGSIPVPVGKTGELVIKGPQVMSGYWNHPDDTASSLRNGWLYTGDIAYMDEDGYFYIVDRKKDMVLIGGYNVYPREIDEVLHQHPKVLDAVSVGIPHPTRGEAIKAYIVLKPGVTMEKHEILKFCRQQLANYKVPREVEFRDSLPKTMVGKTLRRALRAEEEAKLRAAGLADEQPDDIAAEPETLENLGAPETASDIASKITPETTENKE